LGIAGGHHRKTAGGDLRLGLGSIGLAQPHTPARRAKVKPARKAVPKVEADGLHEGTVAAGVLGVNRGELPKKCGCGVIFENFLEWEEPEEREGRHVTGDVGYVTGEHENVTT
jgi:hypothetical protein